MSTLNIVAEWEESITTYRYTLVLCNPSLLLLAGQWLRLLCKELLPNAVLQYILPLIRDVNIDGIVAVGTTDLLLERQVHHLRTLAQPPLISLRTSQTGTVDTALLTGTDTDSLTILYVAYRVTLSILQGDERDNQIALSLRSESLVLGRNILEESRIIKLHLVASLFEGNTEHLLALDRSWHIVRINLDNAVGTLALLLQNLDSLRSVAWSNDTIAYLTLDEEGCSLVAYIAQRNKVAIRAHAVSATRTSIGTSQWRELKLDIINEVNLLQCVAQRQADSCTGRRNVFETSGSRHSCSSLEFLDQLPGIEGIQEVDVARTAVDHFDRKLPSVIHIDARRFLIWITSVLKC